MREAVAGLGPQLQWAADLALAGVPSSAAAVVCGMGGSGISGSFAAALAEAEGRRLAVHKSYGLPGWAGRERPLVVAVSYSGGTEETLEAARAAVDLGLPLAAVTGGGELGALASERGAALVEVPVGLQPRAALGFLVGAVSRVLHAAGVLADPRRGLEEAAGVVTNLVSGDGAGEPLARDLAAGLDGRVAAVYGSDGPAAPAAQRWKTQMNENAKWPAWWSLLPELDHNEVVGWTGLSEVTARRVGIVTLRDRAEHPRVAARFRLTEAVTGDRVRWVGEAWSQGESVLARMMSLAAIGDLVSLELARLAGVDPMPVEVIEDLKRRLSEES